MVKSFIPSFHFVNPSQKLKPKWCLDAADWCYHKTSNRHLLQGKDKKNIDDYASGDFNMRMYKKMFKSIKRAIEFADRDAAHADSIITTADTTGLDWRPLPLIPNKLNAAITTITKIPVEATCTATDALAAKKKMEDIRFLQRKAEVEQQLQGLASQLGLKKVDLGTTKYSAVPFGDSPYGMNLSEPDQSYVFENVLYSLGIEAGFETLLQAWWNLKNAQMIQSMEVKDQFRYGVSCHRTFSSSVTGLPDLEYIQPDTLWVQESKLPDFSDNTHRYIEKEVTAIEMWNHFSKWIGKEDAVYKMLTEKGCGYCSRNSVRTPSIND